MDNVLAVAIEGRPLPVVERRGVVHVDGDTAVVAMMDHQRASVPGGRDVSGNFLLTDVWIKTPRGWQVAERHSSRQGKAAAGAVVQP
jgi:ketosteroid isomerase-like protein